MRTWQGVWLLHGIQVFSTVLELGYGGLAAYLMMLCSVLRVAGRAAAVVTDDYWRGICCGFEGVWFMFVAATVYTHVWNLDVLAFTFWFLFAAVNRAGLERDTFAQQGDEEGGTCG
jgi:hypothetical protein